MFQMYVFIVCLIYVVRGQKLDIEHDFLKAARRVPQFTDAKTKEVYQPPVSSLFAASNNGIIERAEQLQEDGFTTSNADPRFDVSSLCLNNTEIFLSALVAREQWALRSKLL